MKKLYLQLACWILTGYAANLAYGQATSIQRIDSEPGKAALLTLHRPRQTALNTDTKVADVTVSGKVTDEKGTGLPGVSVVVKGSTQGTTTDSDGAYRISAPNVNSTLVFSFVGYQKQEVVIGNQTTITVELAPDNQTLNEVVIVGYGTQRKQDITSAISVIGIDRIGEVPASNVTRLLQGQAPGVVTKQRSGTPGQQFDIRIRGISSLGAAIHSMLSTVFRWEHPLGRT